MMDFSKINSVYCIGIGGAGLSGFARIAKQHGKTVTGSDLVDSAVIQALRSEGIKVTTPQTADNVPLTADLYVYSDAVPIDNPERKVLKKHQLEEKSITYFQAVGELMKVYKQRVAVSGTHGKTTTTAMLALVLEAAGWDPTAIVGSIVKAWQSNVRVGQTRQHCVVEACEYRAHMLDLHPTAIILTNLEEDHLDYYRNLEHIQLTFQEYINRLPSGGMFVRNVDDSESQALDYSGLTVTFGMRQPADYTATAIVKQGHHQTFRVGADTYTIHVPGDFNIYNALAVIAYCRANGITAKTIQIGFDRFNGTWRRFELVGQYKGAAIISDYAHHPTAIASTLKAARECYSNRRVVIVFQPHQHNRTRRLFDKFVSAFDAADLIIMQEIYDVAGREEAGDQSVSARDLVKAIEGRGKIALYSANNARSQKLLAEHVEANDVVLIVGAGDIYLLAEELCSPV